MSITELRNDGLKMVSTKVLRKNMLGKESKRRNCPKAGGPEEVSKYRGTRIR